MNRLYHFISITYRGMDETGLRGGGEREEGRKERRKRMEEGIKVGKRNQHIFGR